MKKQKSTKRALLSSLLSLFLCVAMMIGSTFAWFTDSVTSSSNVIKSGNLDIVVEYTLDGETWKDLDGAEDIFQKGLWEPGHTEVIALRIKNNGSLAFKYTANMNIIDETVGKTKEGNDIVLSEILEVSTYGCQPVDAIETLENAFLSEEGIVWNSPVAFNAGNVIGTEKVLATEEVYYILTKVDMPETIGNEANHDGVNIPAIEFGINVVATQATVESDSFGTDYDKDATYPAVTTTTIGGGEIVKAGNVEVVLPDTAPESEYTLRIDNVKEEVNATGETNLSLNIDLLKDGVKVEAEHGKEYTVNIDMGEDLVVIAGVTHKGEPVTNYSYDPLKNVLTFTTDSFSPFTVTYSKETYRVSNVEELQAVLSDIKVSAKQQIPSPVSNKAYRENAVIVLENDIVIDADTEFMYTDGNGAPLHFYGVRGVLDLNGHNIIVSSDALLAGKAHANAVLLIQYSNIDIIGEGGIVAENKSIPVYGWANSTVNIYGGNYVTNAWERNESAVYVNNNTVMIHVYGGTYNGSKYAFNVHDNCGNTTVMMLHEGITYDDFLKNGTTDVTQSDLDKGRIVVAEGCEIVKNGFGNVVTAK